MTLRKAVASDEYGFAIGLTTLGETLSKLYRKCKTKRIEIKDVHKIL